MTAPTQRFVVVGDTTTARRVCGSLAGMGHRVEHLPRPLDSDLADALVEPAAGVAILLHQDEMSLRYALAVAHAAPEVPMVVSIFDATVSAQINRLLPLCVVTSPGELAAPVLAAACLDPQAAAITLVGTRAGRAYDVVGDALEARPWARSHPRMRAMREWVVSQVMPHDAGSTMLAVGLAGMVAILLADWGWLVVAGESPVNAFQDAVAVVATIGPVVHHGAAYAVFSSIAMLLTLAFSAMFTAGLVDLLLGPRNVGLFGQRALPRGGHVIVVGLGQVGLRLCRHLLSLGVPVVGVERDPRSRYLGIARNLGIPVVVGHGGDRLILERLRVRHAVALAAAGSADLDNIAVAVAARGVVHHARVVLRAGEHEAISETASLLPLGATRDITELSAAYVIAQLHGHEAVLALPCAGGVLVEVATGEVLEWRSPHRDGCRHR